MLDKKELNPYILRLFITRILEVISIVKTIVPKIDDIERKWYIVDAEDQVLGRIASQIAMILRGKHKPTFTPHLDTGDHVIVINAAKIKTTGNKDMQKLYTRYSGYPGGLRTLSLQKIMMSKPERVVLNAVKGMLPKNKLGRQMIKKLRIYNGPEHNQAAQKPEVLPDSLRRL